MASIDLQEIHDFLVGIAHKAGGMITDAKPLAHDTKKNSADLVTETDQAVEKMVSTALNERYPDFECVAALQDCTTPKQHR
jgi:myo-inositol-1(or 4)-monophosphatase